jgi:hypothetical protein
MEEIEQLLLWEEYEPKVNDYVIWEKMGEDNYDEGWVYFKSDEYITIETGVRPRPDAECEGSLHKHIHTLLLCPHQFWGQLKYVKSRKSQCPHHYSECED